MLSILPPYGGARGRALAVAGGGDCRAYNCCVLLPMLSCSWELLWESFIVEPDSCCNKGGARTNGRRRGWGDASSLGVIVGVVIVELPGLGMGGRYRARNEPDLSIMPWDWEPLFLWKRNRVSTFLSKTCRIVNVVALFVLLMMI